MNRMVLLVLVLTGCSRAPAPTESTTDLAPFDAVVETCAACGMVVREQPAPRGQIIHRDGTREFLCSLGDMLRYLEVPSSHGKPRAVYSETMAVDHDLEDLDRDWHPWNPASELTYLMGIDRPGIMGAPIMAYETREAAEHAAETFGGEVLDFPQLQERYPK